MDTKENSEDLNNEGTELIDSDHEEGNSKEDIMIDSEINM